MKEVGCFLLFKQLVIIFYYFVCNGFVEKFNGILKFMLCKMCFERFKDWDRYLFVFLFVYREVL